MNPLFLVVLAMQLFVIMSSKYIRIRQKYSISNLREFNRRLVHKKNMEKKKRSKLFMHSIRVEFIRLNQEVVDICRQTNGYSNFWSPVLTVCLVTPFLSNAISFVHVHQTSTPLHLTNVNLTTMIPHICHHLLIKFGLDF